MVVEYKEVWVGDRFIGVYAKEGPEHVPYEPEPMPWSHLQTSEMTPMARIDSPDVFAMHLKQLEDQLSIKVFVKVYKIGNAISSIGTLPKTVKIRLADIDTYCKPRYYSEGLFIERYGMSIK